ncbi:alpha/beta fold hydrolase [Dactylosporangium sp. CA-139066]|uniref:alpha/beta fold hydrolase n=1 Tax=Dactylosporangium sp. CA-139066 TaxID=3239930 RepID=UPI003D92BACC
MRRVEVRRGDVTLSCLTGGAAGGEPVVLLHGLGGAAEEMRPTAEALAPRYRVVAIDQRGHGHSTRRPEDVSRRAYVDDVAAVIERLFGGRPVAVVGQSMGGHTAMLTAAWYPGLVSRLVMLEAGVGGTEPGDEDYPARLGRWFAGWPVPFRDREAAVEYLGGTPIARAFAADLEEHADGFRARFDADVMERAIEGVAGEARWGEWGSIGVPTLLVRGERGTTSGAEHARMRDAREHARMRDAREHARMRDARGRVRCVLVADAGHDVHLDAPVAWVELLAGFLDAASVAGR